MLQNYYLQKLNVLGKLTIASDCLDSETELSPESFDFISLQREENNKQDDCYLECKTLVLDEFELAMAA